MYTPTVNSFIIIIIIIIITTIVKRKMAFVGHVLRKGDICKDLH